MKFTGIVAIILSLGSCAGLAAQQTESPLVQPADGNAILPIAWIGTWHGEVRSQNASGDLQTFEMTLEIGPTEDANQLSWAVTYDGPQGKSVRPYKLMAVDRAKGHFVIDEQNGVRLDTVLFEDCLTSHFVVGGSRLWSTYRLANGDSAPEIHFELFVGRDEDVSATGGEGDVPEVRSLKAQSRQFAVLRRIPTDNGPDASLLSQWTKLTTEPYRGKQDDVVFVNEMTGWYVNGAGKIFQTVDGGDTWTLQLHKPGTYFRCIAFVDELRGFAGNIGPGYFPDVSDTNPLYQTEDGGKTWSAVTTIEGPAVVGLCALQVLREEFVNAGQLDQRIRLIGTGRVGGPVALIVSDDLGKTWQQIPVTSDAAMAFDVHFFNRNEGFIAAATNVDVTQSHALILSTQDGGKTWTRAWQSKRPWELTWKISFPTRKVGYVTIQSYNPDPEADGRFVAKTVDGGESWTEVPLINDARVRQFGVAFLDEKIGWVGAVPHGFLTTDGGSTWSQCDMGNAVNKIRILKSDTGVTAFAIGTNVHRLRLPAVESK